MLFRSEAKARAALVQARKIYDQLGDKSGLGDLQTIEAQLELNLGRVALARAKLGQARTLYAVAGNATKQGDAGLAMVQIDLSQGYNRLARVTLDQTLADFTQANDATGTARTRIAEGDLERLQGRLRCVDVRIFLERLLNERVQLRRLEISPPAGIEIAVGQKFLRITDVDRRRGRGRRQLRTGVLTDARHCRRFVVRTGGTTCHQQQKK